MRTMNLIKSWSLFRPTSIGWVSEHLIDDDADYVVSLSPISGATILKVPNDNSEKEELGDKLD